MIINGGIMRQNQQIETRAGGSINEPQRTEPTGTEPQRTEPTCTEPSGIQLPRILFGVLLVLSAAFMLVGCTGTAEETKGFYEIIGIAPEQVQEISIEWQPVDEDAKKTYLSLFSELRLKELYRFGDNREKPWFSILRGEIRFSNHHGHEFSVIAEDRIVINNGYYQANKEALRKILEFGGTATALISSFDSPAFRGENVDFSLEGDVCDRLIELIKNTAGDKVFQYESKNEAPLGTLSVYVRDKFGVENAWYYITENRIVLDDALYTVKIDDMERILLFLREQYRMRSK